MMGLAMRLCWDDSRRRLAELPLAGGQLRKVPVNASALSEARFHAGAKWGAVLCARSIDPFGGSRWRLRRMRQFWELWVFYLFQMS